MCWPHCWLSKASGSSDAIRKWCRELAAYNVSASLILQLLKAMVQRSLMICYDIQSQPNLVFDICFLSIHVFVFFNVGMRTGIHMRFRNVSTTTRYLSLSHARTKSATAQAHKFTDVASTSRLHVKLQLQPHANCIWMNEIDTRGVTWVITRSDMCLKVQTEVFPTPQWSVPTVVTLYLIQISLQDKLCLFHWRLMCV